MDQRGLADFLRNRRERITPGAAGVAHDGPRRTPGLRREEVAALAHISVSYYVQLEQARAAQPSARVLDALHRALRLDDDGRALLFHLAGQADRAAHSPRRDVPRSILDLLERMPDTAAVVLDAGHDVLAWNPLAAALLEDYSGLPPARRNLVHRHFVRDPAVPFRPMSGADQYSRYAVGRLRQAVARYPRDERLQDLVTELRAASPEFENLWRTGDVTVAEHRVKTLVHPVVGPLELSCDTLEVPDRDQHVVLFTAEPGSASQRALTLLAVVGTQQLAPEPAG